MERPQPLTGLGCQPRDHPRGRLRLRRVHGDARLLLQPDQADAGGGAGQAVRCLEIGVPVARAGCLDAFGDEAVQVGLEGAENGQQILRRQLRPCRAVAFVRLAAVGCRTRQLATTRLSWAGERERV